MNRQYLYLAIITFLALALRVIIARNTGLTFWDEANYLEEANFLRGIGNQPLALGKPTFSLLIAISQTIVGNKDFAGQIVSAIMGAATVPVIYFLINGLFNRRAAILASALLALSPFHIILSRLILADTTSVFFLTLAILIGVGQKSNNLSALSGIAAGLSFTSNLKLLFIPLLFVLIYRQDLKRLLIWFIFFSLPIIIWEIPHHLISHSFPSYLFQLINLYSSSADLGLYNPLLYPYTLLAYITWPILLLALISLKQPRKISLFLIWIFLFTLPLLINVHKAPRAISFIIVPIVILAALGLDRILQKKFTQNIIIKILIILFFVSASIPMILQTAKLQSAQKSLSFYFTNPQTQKIITTQFPVTKYYLNNFNIAEFPNNDKNKLKELHREGYRYLVVDNQAFVSFENTSLLQDIESHTIPLATFIDSAKSQEYYFLEHSDFHKTNLIQMINLKEEVVRKRGQYLKIYDLDDYFLKKIAGHAKN